MNSKTGSIKINIPTTTKAKVPAETGKKSGTSGEFSSKAWLRSVWDYCKEDSSRVIFPLKVGLAVLLVSSLILFEAPYEIFGSNIMWAILTVVLVFECTVGATFNRGFNRALGSLLAGVMAIAVAQIALSCGPVAEPIIIGFSIFLVAAMTSFIKMWPSLLQYEYGIRVILLTYCLIIVSGYRIGNPIKTSMDRLYSIAIGGIMSVLVNVFVCPIWAGEQLHKELVKNFDSVADSLEECVKNYLEDDGSVQSEFTTTSMDEFPEEAAYERCRGTLNSGPKLETLASSAKWEPPHGRFLHFFYPWSQYLNVGAVLRYCAGEVMALHSILHSEIQAPHNLRMAFRSEIQEVSDQAAELVRSLGRDISNMNWSLKSSLIKKVHSSTERLQRSIDLHSYRLMSTFESDKPSKPLFRALSSTLSHLSEQTANLETKSPEKNPTPVAQNMNIHKGVTPPAQLQKECSYHEMVRKQSRRLYSWPSREVDAFEQDSGTTMEFCRMRAFGSTSTLSLVNFTSSLIEFVARLDHLVEAAEKLSNMAKFKHQGL